MCCRVFDPSHKDPDAALSEGCVPSRRLEMTIRRLCRIAAQGSERFIRGREREREASEICTAGTGKQPAVGAGQGSPPRLDPVAGNRRSGVRAGPPRFERSLGAFRERERERSPKRIHAPSTRVDARAWVYEPMSRCCAIGLSRGSRLAQAPGVCFSPVRGASQSLAHRCVSGAWRVSRNAVSCRSGPVSARARHNPNVPHARRHASVGRKVFTSFAELVAPLKIIRQR